MSNIRPYQPIARMTLTLFTTESALGSCYGDPSCVAQSCNSTDLCAFNLKPRHNDRLSDDSCNER
ncbi:hypothetical protein PRIPAC_71820 [Pristionchus pacificus]|uniref:Uncharacterized protein n=1 Tax=Pristionchus pacificus TaxID=54126 RepID=A0A2A6CFJ1_PRIPA|nr:hypothetical protein PRIPAC_71820 [Pristionchus pacificus]|eukprot:PDM76972.1 hypothetical protein PRIPAC_42367 [Pristionchus pacificus]